MELNDYDLWILEQIVKQLDANKISSYAKDLRMIIRKIKRKK